MSSQAMTMEFVHEDSIEVCPHCSAVYKIIRFKLTGLPLHEELRFCPFCGEAIR